MARILITSGPTRQFLDPVRYLTNASSGKMGCCLAHAALLAGHEVVVITGPVEIEYPLGAQVVGVITTDEMLAETAIHFPDCDGLIGAAAPCDYKPVHLENHKITKTGHPLRLELQETPDVVATMGAQKRDDQWVVGFALETEDARFRALVKLEKKSCDLIVSNGPAAMNSDTNDVEILDSSGKIVQRVTGTKQSVAEAILNTIGTHLTSFHAR